MNGLELDQRMRAIMVAVTRENVLSSTAALVELGFGARQSFEMVEKILIAKEKGTWQKSRTKRRRNS